MVDQDFYDDNIADDPTYRRKTDRYHGIDNYNEPDEFFEPTEEESDEDGGDEAGDEVICFGGEE